MQQTLSRTVSTLTDVPCQWHAARLSRRLLILDLILTMRTSCRQKHTEREAARSPRDVLHLEPEACSCVRLILVPGGLREEEISGPPWSHDWLNPRCRFPTWLPCWTANWQTEARFQSGPSTLALPALTQLLLLGNDSLMISCLTSNRHLIDC